MIKLAFLWHQHQPYYKNLLTGDYMLPWVRLHGVKDYLDMVEILGDYPSIRQVFNMVPSLLEQIMDYAAGTATDPHLKLSEKKASELSAEEKNQMIKLLFQANYDNLIAPFRKYRSLYSSRENAISEWTEDDWRDLQCLANLSWIDPLFRKKGRLKDLTGKGESYSEEDKHEILRFQLEIISRIIPTLKQYMQSGQIEISVTPFFHPIMPLLYDTSCALTAMPHAPMPQNRFRHPEDVDKQVEMAANLYQGLFGKLPVGMWPSEGSVSEEILPILQKHGIKWIATDEEILAESKSAPSRSTGRGDLVSSGELYRCHKFQKEKTRMAIFFRDHALSDNIGFVYSAWDPEKAADDFISKLKAIDKNLTKKNVAAPIVSIILDGENAWEYYKNDGHDFLKAIYARISKQPWIETTTYEDFLSGKPKGGKLKKLFPGSWINHNFSVWIGHEEDNKAWDLLSRARNELVEFQQLNSDFEESKLVSAWREIYIAEGSDWCWWFGDDHVGPNNDEFDSLYRSHLANVYYFTGREPPEELFRPVRSSFILAHISKPIDYITPTIDGRLTHYYEWNQAGFFDCMKAGSTMHKSENMLQGIWFGYDSENLYLMMKGGITVDPDRLKALDIEIEFQDPTKNHIIIKGGSVEFVIAGKKIEDFKFGFEQIMEIAVPLNNFPLSDDNNIFLRIFIKKDGKLLESWPPADSLVIPIPKEGSGEIPWIV
ncbi:MAG: glycoside hydrolase [Candidatus Zixiibacteriota bacterium]|nr:MAG: glycoside hydrolase [candidate division Zixibacteria bacterium]